MNQEHLGVTEVPVVRMSLILSSAEGDYGNHKTHLIFHILWVQPGSESQL